MATPLPRTMWRQTLESKQLKLTPIAIGSILYIAGLFTFVEIHKKNQYDRYFSSVAESIGSVNNVIGISLGKTSDRLSIKQEKIAAKLLRYLTQDSKIQCLQIKGKDYLLSYPPVEYCSQFKKGYEFTDQLDNSSGLNLVSHSNQLLIDKQVSSQSIFLYIGGSMIAIMAIAAFKSATKYQEHKQKTRFDLMMNKVFNDSPIPCIVVDKALEVCSFSSELQKYTNSEALKADLIRPKKWSLEDLFENNSLKRITRVLNTFKDEESFMTIRMKDINLNTAHKLVFSAVISPLFYSDQTKYLVQISDETRSKVQQDLLFEELNFDQLTKCYSRRYLFETFSDTSRSASYYLFFIDIDEFKSININYGHDAGDHLLRKAGKLFLDLFDRSCTAIRLGGDQFIVLKQTNGSDELEQACQAIYRNSTISIKHNDVYIQKNLSFAATTLRQSESLSECLKRADIALSKLKKSGTHNYVVFDNHSQINLPGRHKREISIEDLINAYHSDAINLFLQPVFDAGSNAPVGYETLARLSIDNQNIAPIDFLTSLYKLATLSEIGFDHYSLLERLLLNLSPKLNGWISYNINEIDLNDQYFPKLLRCLKGCLKNKSKREFVLEISESSFQSMTNSSSLLDRISLLKSLGFLFALDDFWVL